MSDNLDDTIYTITTGFYPHLFAGKGTSFIQGRGKVGARFTQVKGWAGTKSFTIQKNKDGGKTATVNKDLIGNKKEEDFFKDTKGGTFKDIRRRNRGNVNKKDTFKIKWNKLNQDERTSFLTQAKGKGNAWRAKIDTEDTSDAVARPQEGTSQAEMEKHLSYAKFIGNNNLYKIWGSKIWYQHAASEDKKVIENGLQQWIKNEPKTKASFLNTLYSKSEKDLAEVATDMAKKIFGQAVDEVKLEALSKKEKPDVAEETRTLPEMKEMDSMITKDGEDLRKISRARQLDIKMRMENGTTMYMDSTEMPITQADQHGIIKENLGQLKELIKEAKAASGTKGEKGAVEALRQGVVSMFTKNVKSYNQTFSKMYKEALKTSGGKKGKEAMLKWLKDIKKENLKRLNKSKDAAAPVREHKARVTVANIGSKIGISSAKADSQSTILKYNVHMMMNMMGSAKANYRQGHFVGMLGGERAYASIPLGFSISDSVGPRMLYAKKRQEKTIIIKGPSHSLAIRQAMSEQISSAATQEAHAAQVQTYTMGRMMNGVSVTKQKEGYVSADLTNRMAVRNPTRVTFNPRGLQDKIQNVIGDIKDSIKDGGELGRMMDKYMANNKSNQLSDKAGLSKNTSTKFWALPYIGIQEFSDKR